MADFLMHSCALLCSGALLVRYGRGSGAFFARFLFLREVSRVSARSLQSGDDGKKQIAKRQVRYENKRQKRQKRGEGVKKVNAKEKEKVKDSERESVKKEERSPMRRCKHASLSAETKEFLSK